MKKTKILFNIINIIFVILYIYPGSILGYIVYGTIRKQPQLTPDIMSISSNHVYAFFILSLIGLIAYYRSSKVIILIYLIMISIVLEVLHLVIPSRLFQYSDLFGNIVGVFLSIVFFNIYNFWRKR